MGIIALASCLLSLNSRMCQLGSTQMKPTFPNCPSTLVILLQIVIDQIMSKWTPRKFTILSSNASPNEETSDIHPDSNLN
jgi:hypothetical protein